MRQRVLPSAFLWMVLLIDEWKKLRWEAKTHVMEVEFFEMMIMQEPHY